MVLRKRYHANSFGKSSYPCIARKSGIIRRIGFVVNYELLVTIGVKNASQNAFRVFTRFAKFRLNAVEVGEVFCRNQHYCGLDYLL